MQCKNSARCQAQVSVLWLEALQVQEMSGKALSVHSQKSQTAKEKKAFPQYSHPPATWNVFRNTWMVVFFCFFVLFFWAQAHRHARLDCDTPQLTRRCTVLPPPNRCYWSVRAHQRPRYTCWLNLRTIFYNLPVFSLSGVSAARPLVPLHSRTNSLPNKGGPDHGPTLPTVTPALLKRHKITFEKKITSPVHRLFLISQERWHHLQCVPSSWRLTLNTLQLHLSWKPYSIYSVLREFLLFFFLGKTFVFKCFIFCTFICNISCK